MEQQRPVRILIGSDSFSYENKAEIPVPEVPFGEPFEVQVEWDERTDPRQSLTLSDFVAVILDGKGEPSWRAAEGELRLEVRDEGYSRSGVKNGVSFSRPESGGLDSATVVIHGSEEVDYPEDTTLVFFTVELVTATGATANFDPPWVKKRRG